MTWPVVIVFGYVCLGLELSIKTDVLAITRWHGVAPSFVLPYVCFLALLGPNIPVMWVALAMGLVLDLTAGGSGDGGVAGVGARALGMAAVVFFVMTMRPLMNRRAAISVVFASVAGGVLYAAVVAGVMAARGMLGYADVEMLTSQATTAGRTALEGASGRAGPLAVLISGLGSALYTGVTALCMGLVLMRLANWFGFVEMTSRRGDPSRRSFAR